MRTGPLKRSTRREMFSFGRGLKPAAQLEGNLVLNPNSSESFQWAEKLFFRTAMPEEMSAQDIARVLSRSDSLRKEVRDAATVWADSGSPPTKVSGSNVKERPFIEAVGFISQVHSHYERIYKDRSCELKKLIDDCLRSNGQFSSYLKLIRDGSHSTSLVDLAKSYTAAIGSPDAESFIQDVLTLPRGAALTREADLILTVWKDCRQNPKNATNAARTIARHLFLVLYKDDAGSAGIETNCTTETDLFRMFTARYVDQADGDLEPYLQPLFDIACSLRGYKSNVSEVKVLRAGAAIFPNSKQVS